MQLLTGNKKKSKKSISMIGLESQSVSNSEDRCARIALFAYYKTETRGYGPGQELEDWVEAEADAEVEKSK